MVLKWLSEISVKNPNRVYMPCKKHLDDFFIKKIKEIIIVVLRGGILLFFVSHKPNKVQKDTKRMQKATWKFCKKNLVDAKVFGKIMNGHGEILNDFSPLPPPRPMVTLCVFFLSPGMILFPEGEVAGI